MKLCKNTGIPVAERVFYWRKEMIKKFFGGHEKGAEDDIFRPKNKGSFVVFADRFSVFS